MEEIEQLLEEFNENRVALKAMITDLESVKERIESLFPTDTDNFRHRHIFAERVKSATELFKALLDIRRELARSIKDEIEIRRKIDLSEDDDLDKVYDIREMAGRLEKLVENTKKTEKKEEARVRNKLANSKDGSASRVMMPSSVPSGKKEEEETESKDETLDSLCGG